MEAPFYDLGTGGLVWGPQKMVWLCDYSIGWGPHFALVNDLDVPRCGDRLRLELMRISRGTATGVGTLSPYPV